jgi:hypothetical protein
MQKREDAQRGQTIEQKTILTNAKTLLARADEVLG